MSNVEGENKNILLSQKPTRWIDFPGGLNIGASHDQRKQPQKKENATVIHAPA